MSGGGDGYVGQREMEDLRGRWSGEVDFGTEGRPLASFQDATLSEGCFGLTRGAFVPHAGLT